MIDYRKYGQEAQKSFSGINIVPLTDVILVLLIIFMIAAPSLAQSAFKISLAQASPSLLEQVQQAADPKSILYVSAAQIHWNTQAYPITEIAKLQSALQDALKQGTLSKQQIYLNIDKRLRHEDTVRILDTLKTLGIAEIYVGIQRQ